MYFAVDENDFAVMKLILPYCEVDFAVMKLNLPWRNWFCRGEIDFAVAKLILP